MAGFIDENDVRRPQTFPRLSERYRAPVDAAWYLPSRRKVVKGKPVRVEAQVLDLSVAGALLKSQANERAQIGQRTRFELNGFEGIVEIRNIRPSSASQMYYGVLFFSVSEAMKTELFRIVGDIRPGDLEDQWRRSH
jgi:hypothetical protein